MSTRPDHEQSISEWLVAQASDRAPERLLASSRDQIRNTRQRRAWWPAGRIPEMNNTVRVIAASAAVVVAALIGYQLFVGPNVGGPGPSVSPSPAPSEGGSGGEIHAGDLEPGTYTVTAFDGSDITIQFTVPDGWNWNEGWYLSKSRGAEFPAGVGVGFVTGDIQVYTDPCQWEDALPDPPTGPLAEDVIRALAAQPTREATEPTERAAAGPDGPDAWPGWTVSLTVPTSFTMPGCDGNQFRSWGPEANARWHQGGGQQDYNWAVDLQDARLVMFIASFPPNPLGGTPASVIAEAEAILDSIMLSQE